MSEVRSTEGVDILDRLKADKSFRSGKHGPAGYPCHCWQCDSIAEIERLRAQCASLKAGYDSMFDKAAELERRLANG